ncbi:glycine cleavage system protein GcvH [Saxibacter everestensis]|uniref:Glycine cleavage system H protein n=1 Tax=Saxibacter everestensis TaxID=2909229 RepID=A0ABY8QW81_9MICO|nr:glycine cleavage system protein GcvH [Brevibacteriaceae bacterium ZFBP1038]
MAELQYPEGLQYTAEHEWVAGTDSESVVRVGITAFAQDALGDVVFVDLPAVGDQIAGGSTCGEVESTKSVSDIFAPLSGTVSAINETLEATPELINSDPYGQGWLFEIDVDDISTSASLLSAADYRQLV